MCTMVQADLAVAIPALEEAVAALNTIKPTDINEIKALTKPPVSIYHYIYITYNIRNTD